MNHLRGFQNLYAVTTVLNIKEFRTEIYYEDAYYPVHKLLSSHLIYKDAEHQDVKKKNFCIVWA
jgi:hypothetical protein